MKRKVPENWYERNYVLLIQIDENIFFYRRQKVINDKQLGVLEFVESVFGEERFIKKETFDAVYNSNQYKIIKAIEYVYINEQYENEYIFVLENGRQIKVK